MLGCSNERASETRTMNSAVRTRLSVMMFLELAIWGAWLPLLSTYLTGYLGFTGEQAGWVANTFALAAITAWLFGGQMADRYFEQSRFLSFSHLMGGLAMLGMVFVKQLWPAPAGVANHQYLFWPIFGLMMVHCFFYLPTLSLTNAIAFANLKDPQKEFGLVRLWGTIGWIAASLPFVFLLADWAKIPGLGQAGFLSWIGAVFGTPKSGPVMESALRSMFLLSAVLSFVLAAVCLTLPRTPPARGEGSFAPFEALAVVLKNPALAILFVITFLDAIVIYCYFLWSGPFYTSIGIPANLIAPAMSLGQFAEVPAMALLGLALKGLGWRWTMAFGLVMQAARFLIYAYGAQHPELAWLVVASNLAHGFAYAFFFATVYILVDESVPKDSRASAQALFNLAIMGVGQFVGNWMWGRLGDRLTTVGADGSKVTDFYTLFLYTTGVALAATILLLVGFWPRKSAAREETAPSVT
jgi:nucleoside transporter